MYYSFVTIILASFLLSANCDFTPFECLSCMKMRVGHAEYVYGPVPAPLDNPFFSLIVDGTLFGYSANGNTDIIVKGELNDTSTTSTSTPSPTIGAEIDVGGAEIEVGGGAGIEVGGGAEIGVGSFGGVGKVMGLADMKIALECSNDASQFDYCGSWMNSAIPDGDIIRGWYHAETKCNYDVGQTFKSVAYCESHDGGLTFKKPNYPNNQVITGSLPPTPNIAVGNGDHSVIKNGDYYYLYFINWDDYGHCVARSPVSSGGVPGSWRKYYKGSWSQPGIGGDSTGLYGLAGTTVHQHSSGNLLGVGNGNGVSLSIGEDPVTWTKLSEPLLFAEGSEWNRSPTASELIAYPSLVPIEGGNGPIDNHFWLYYTYLQPGEYYSHRYLVRREVYITMDNVPDNAPQGGVELSRFVSDATMWTTTSLPLVGNFTYKGSMGYTLTAEYDNTNPIYDCYIPSWSDYMLTINRNDCSEKNGIVLLRHMGWVYRYQPLESIIPTSPIYRCFNGNTLKHSISHYQDCEGNGTLEFILGWTMDY